MKRRWFKKWGWVFRPCAWQGVLLLLGAAAFVAEVFRAVDRHSHSASDTIYGVFPYVTCVFLLLNWVAAHTSPTSDEP
jgi:hypothetical protein